MMLAQPTYSGDSFREQVLGKVSLFRYFLDTKELYFTAPELSEQEFNDAIARFVVDRSKITLATDSSVKLRLDKYTMDKTSEISYFFKTALENLKFDPNTNFDFPYQGATYNLTMREMLDFAENKTVYGGRVAATTNPQIDGKAIMFGNHGSMVSKPDEPSIKEWSRRFWATERKIYHARKNSETSRFRHDADRI